MHSSTPAYCPNCGSTRGYYARSGKCTDCGVAWDSGLGVMGGTFSADVAYTPADPGNLTQAWLDNIRNHSPLLTPYYNAAQALLSAPTKTTALVTAFQNAFNASSVYKLPVTGVYDSATENAMGDYYQYLADVAAEALQNAAVKTSALVTAFQKAHNLTVNSSYQVPVTGIYDAATKSALYSASYYTPPMSAGFIAAEVAGVGVATSLIYMLGGRWLMLLGVPVGLIGGLLLYSVVNRNKILATA